MKFWRYKFKQDVSDEQHATIIAGFSSLYYYIQEILDKATEGSKSQLAKLGARVINQNMVNMIMSNMDVINKNLQDYFSWEWKDKQTFEVKFDNTTFNKLFNFGPMPPKVGDKLTKRIDSLFKDQICPKTGIKYDDVEIERWDAQ